jgi:hypothetical protein
MAAKDDGLSFDKEEAEVLRQIVGDWLNEELGVPPFPPAMEAVLKKLGLEAPTLAETASVARNEVTARPGPRSE